MYVEAGRLDRKSLCPYCPICLSVHVCTCMNHCNLSLLIFTIIHVHTCTYIVYMYIQCTCNTVNVIIHAMDGKGWQPL